MVNIRRRSTCTVARIERRKLEILVIHMNQRIRVSSDVGNEEVFSYLLRFVFPHKLLSLIIFMLHLHTRTTLSKSESFEVKYVYVLMLCVCTCVCVCVCARKGGGGGGNNGHPNP